LLCDIARPDPVPHSAELLVSSLPFCLREWLFSAVPWLGQNFHIKRLELLFFCFINELVEFRQVNFLGVFRSRTEFAVKILKVNTFRQLFVTLSLDVLFDIAFDHFKKSGHFDFRMG